MRSSLMWVQGNASLDLQGISGMPGLQPWLDASSSSSSMFGFQPDTYQAMSSLQDRRPPQQAPTTALQNNTQTINSSFMLQPLPPLSFADHHQLPLRTLFDSFPQGGSWPSQQAGQIEPESHDQNDVSLPPFPGREEDHQHQEQNASRQRHGLYGVETDADPSSLLMMNGVSSGFSRRDGGDSSSSALPPVFGSSNFAEGDHAAGLSAVDFSLNHHQVMAPSSYSMGESSFMYSQENAEEGHFVKVSHHLSLFFIHS